MYHHSCNDCYFSGQCYTDDDCENFTFISESEEEILSEMVERDRAEYREAFFKYIDIDN